MLSDSTRSSAWVTSGGSSLATGSGELGVAADGGQRGAQLVAGVGHEVTYPGLARLARGQRRADVVQHPVERGPDLADLGAGVGVGLGDAHREGDLAAVERQLGDPARGGRDPAQRPQRQADDGQPEERGQHQPEQGHQRDDGREAIDGVQCVVERQCRDDGGAVLGLGGDDAVVVQPAPEVPRVRVVRRQGRRSADRSPVSLICWIWPLLPTTPASTVPPGHLRADGADPQPERVHEERRVVEAVVVAVSPSSLPGRPTATGSGFA